MSTPRPPTLHQVLKGFVRFYILQACEYYNDRQYGFMDRLLPTLLWRGASLAPFGPATQGSLGYYIISGITH